jgi:hypothetical protein
MTGSSRVCARAASCALRDQRRAAITSALGLILVSIKGSCQSGVGHPDVPHEEAQVLITAHIPPNHGDEVIPSSYQSDRIILAVWSAGVVKWSANQFNGGEPYHLSTLRPREVSELLARLETLLASLKEHKVEYTRGITPYMTIRVTAPAGEWTLVSPHELKERHGTAIVTQDGLFGIYPENRQHTEEITQRRTPEYIKFRAVWQGIREECRRLVERS